MGPISATILAEAVDTSKITNWRCVVPDLYSQLRRLQTTENRCPTSAAIWFDIRHFKQKEGTMVGPGPVLPIRTPRVWKTPSSVGGLLITGDAAGCGLESPSGLRRTIVETVAPNRAKAGSCCGKKGHRRNHDLASAMRTHPAHHAIAVSCDRVFPMLTEPESSVERSPGCGLFQ